VRREHCEMSDPEQMARVLGEARIGCLATVDAEGYPYVTPVNFVFHDGCVYFHCAREGEKLDNLRRDPRVCFEVDIPLAYVEVGFNPEMVPCRAHQLYHCVVIRGRARVVADEALKLTALNALVAKHEEKAEFSPVTAESAAFKLCDVVEIRPERMTGKSDVLQNKPKEGYRLHVARRLVERGLPGDLKAVKAMGYRLSEDGEIEIE
jgi:nitroimidazol reductase NimA-like FMN-containing flavoprotein (pyridoxamine 5'-phosphate oxidase superfamily)